MFVYDVPLVSNYATAIHTFLFKQESVFSRYPISAKLVGQGEYKARGLVVGRVTCKIC